MNIVEDNGLQNLTCTDTAIITKTNCHFIRNWLDKMMNFCYGFIVFTSHGESFFKAWYIIWYEMKWESGKAKHSSYGYIQCHWTCRKWGEKKRGILRSSFQELRIKRTLLIAVFSKPPKKKNIKKGSNMIVLQIATINEEKCYYIFRIGKWQGKKKGLAKSSVGWILLQFHWLGSLHNYYLFHDKFYLMITY